MNDDLSFEDVQQLSRKLFQEMKIDRQTGCIISPRKRSPEYIKIQHNNTVMAAHRWVFRLCKGATNQPVIRHLCHNKQCINPAHFECGSQSDNCLDNVKDGRGKWNLNNESVRTILRDYGNYSKTINQLADEIGVPRRNVVYVVSGFCFYVVGGNQNDRDAALTRWNNEKKKEAFTDEQVQEIRSQYYSCEQSIGDLAAKHRVHPNVINHVIGGKLFYSRYPLSDRERELRLTARKYFHAQQIRQLTERHHAR